MKYLYKVFLVIIFFIFSSLSMVAMGPQRLTMNHLDKNPYSYTNVINGFKQMSDYHIRKCNPWLWCLSNCLECKDVIHLSGSIVTPFVAVPLIIQGVKHYSRSQDQCAAACIGVECCVMATACCCMCLNRLDDEKNK